MQQQNQVKRHRDRHQSTERESFKARRNDLEHEARQNDLQKRAPESLASKEIPTTPKNLDEAEKSEHQRVVLDQERRSHHK
ncbi:hypothetical protein PS6_010481 [Mucor atramentarius]